MTHKEFCEECRILYNKKVYSKTVLLAYVKKGALSNEEYNCIVNKEPFPWERTPDVEETEVEQ